MNEFKKALKKLGIESYGNRIFNSNSNGELFHLQQYVDLADAFTGDKILFCIWFKYVVNFAEENWERPESVFQHIYEIATNKTTY